MPKLLIVDDEEATVDMLVTYFNLIGHDAIPAYSGEEGVIMAEAEDPDVMLLDLMMPDLAGFDVCRQLRKREKFSTLPILIISARIDKDSQEKAHEAGADGYMTKPLDLPRLTGEIQRLLANPPNHQVSPKSDDAGKNGESDSNLTTDNPPGAE